MRTFMLTGLVFLSLVSVPASAEALRGDEAFSVGDYATAYREWRQSADAGSASAMSAIGALYDVGRGVPQDFTEALSWYRRAAEAGNVPAMFNVGAMYLNGRGAAVDRAEGVRWWRLAAGRGNGRAAYDLGVIYRDGNGVPRDAGAAIRFFRLAAGAGIGAAQSNLVALGARTAAHALAAVESPGAPAKQPRTARGANDELGRFQHVALARGDLDVSSSASFAELVPTLADRAATGDDMAQYDVGFAFEHGIGTAADRVKSYVYYLRATASRRGDVKAAATRGASEMGGQLTDQQHAAARDMLVSGAR